MQATFFHSPFSRETVSDGNNPALLLQFILNELIKEETLIKTILPFSSPFDWKNSVGSMNKVTEHAQLLAFAFPLFEKEAKDFQESLDLPCFKLIALLEPFILAAKENVYLLYFLMQHKSNVAVSQLLTRIPKENIEKMQSVVATKYRKKGLSPPPWIY
ncbi:MAG: hypothetical protein LVR00_03650 [Rhabdochlamydiaceae bacterium]|jgi:hypothetical protein